MLQLPHMTHPFGRDPATGKVRVAEQGSIEHIRSVEYAITMYPAGFRPERPDFGWPQPVLGTEPIDPGPLVEALDRLEPYGAPRDAAAYVDAADPSKTNIVVTDHVAGDQS